MVAYIQNVRSYVQTFTHCEVLNTLLPGRPIQSNILIISGKY